ncbi:MAG TPA: DUF4382 domain-containing protein [Verrucomicrobiae bacterium]|nr:DUF4382 domain-containing protein [Verrucomicrobiae bacterium]
MDWKRTFGYLFGFTVVSVLLTLSQGCGGGGGGGSFGRLTVAVTDKNATGIDSAVISIKEVRAVPAGMEGAADGDAALPLLGRWETPKVIDVMKLGAGKTTLQEMIGDAVIPAGTYTQIRLVLSPNVQGQQPANYVMLTGGAMKPMHVAAGSSSGLKIKGNIQVQAGAVNAVLLDFDPNTAINGSNYTMNERGIRIVQLSDPRVIDTFGSILGSVVAQGLDLASSATVSVAPVGSAQPVAAGYIFSNYTTQPWHGAYSMFVPEGTYKVYVKANGFATYSSPATTVAAKTVNEIAAPAVLVPAQ